MLMKKYCVIVFFLFATCLNAQKNFTLKQVILESNTLLPRELKQLQWIPGTDDFSYVFQDESVEILLKENANDEGKKSLFSLTKLNTVFHNTGLATLYSFPKYKWIPNNKLQFWNFNTLINYDLTTNTVPIINDIDDNKELKKIKNHMFIISSQIKTRAKKKQNKFDSEQWSAVVIKVKEFDKSIKNLSINFMP